MLAPLAALFCSDILKVVTPPFIAMVKLSIIAPQFNLLDPPLYMSVHSDRKLPSDWYVASLL